MSESKIQFISPEQTVDLRSRVLRPGQPLSACHYENDNAPATFHLGVLHNNEIISNGTFLQQGHEKFSEARYPYRLRGMATDPAHQKKGYGRDIVIFALGELKKRNSDLLWFNARTSAEGFYLSLGFEVIENIFDIPGVGPHKVMYRWL